MVQFIYIIFFNLVAGNKGEAEPERKETRNKVDEDRKHEYPFIVNLEIILQFLISFFWFEESGLT